MMNDFAQKTSFGKDLREIHNEAIFQIAMQETMQEILEENLEEQKIKDFIEYEIARYYQEDTTYVFKDKESGTLIEYLAHNDELRLDSYKTEVTTKLFNYLSNKLGLDKEFFHNNGEEVEIVMMEDFTISNVAYGDFKPPPYSYFALTNGGVVGIAEDIESIIANEALDSLNVESLGERESLKEILQERLKEAGLGNKFVLLSSYDEYKDNYRIFIFPNVEVVTTSSYPYTIGEKLKITKDNIKEALEILSNAITENTQNQYIESKIPHKRNRR